MRYLLCLLLLTSCAAPMKIDCRCVKKPELPEDRIGDLINSGAPDWVIKNYAKWVRYAYDLH